MSRVVKEAVIFMALLIVLTFGMHAEQLISHPIEHIKNVDRGMFGAFHPLIFTFMAYVIVFIARKIFSFFIGLFITKS